MTGNNGTSVLFISYSTYDEFQVQQIVEVLRKEQIQVYAYPFDIPGASDIQEGIHVQETVGPVMLAVALSQNSLGTSWVKKGIPKLIDRFSEALSGTLFLKLVDLTARDIARLNYAKGHDLLDLSGEDFASGLQRLVERLGSMSGRKAAASPTQAKLAPYTMTGVFEPARPATELFTELKRQVELGLIDQKYLYWDVRAALRWERIAELSGYMTVQMATNLLAASVADIAKMISADVPSLHVSLVNLGVGTGVKDYLILSHLLQKFDQVTYFAVDESFPMIQLTMQNLEDLVAGAPASFSAHFIVDDLINIERNLAFIREMEGDRVPRLISFDNMLGNFREGFVTQVIQNFMDHTDYLLLGLEFIAERSDDELIRNYSDRRMREFLFGPITDATGSIPDWEKDFSYQIVSSDPYRRYSEVQGSKVIIGHVRFNKKDVELFFATKYDPDAIERYLTEQLRFKIVHKFESPEVPARYALYLLRLG